MKKLTNTIRAKVILMFTVPFMTGLALIFYFLPFQVAYEQYQLGESAFMIAYVGLVLALFGVCFFIASEYEFNLREVKK